MDLLRLLKFVKGITIWLWGCMALWWDPGTRAAVKHYQVLYVQSPVTQKHIPYSRRVECGWTNLTHFNISHGLFSCKLCVVEEACRVYTILFTVVPSVFSWIWLWQMHTVMILHVSDRYVHAIPYVQSSVVFGCKTNTNKTVMSNMSLTNLNCQQAFVLCASPT